MKEYGRKLLDKAIDAIEAVEILVDNKKELKFNKHSAVHAAFGEHFAKTKEMDVKFHRWLLDSFDRRQVADYEVDMSLTETWL